MECDMGVGFMAAGWIGLLGLAGFVVCDLLILLVWRRMKLRWDGGIVRGARRALRRVVPRRGSQVGGRFAVDRQSNPSSQNSLN